MRVPPALLAIALLSGCIGGLGGDPNAEHSFGGVFLSTVLPGEILDIGDRVQAEGGDFTSDGKIPPAFVARGLTQGGCDLARSYTMTKLYIERLDRCAPLDPEQSSEPTTPSRDVTAHDAPVLTSAPVSDVPWP